MNRIALCLSLLTLLASIAWACPEGTHSETKTKSDYVCSPSSDYVCEWVYSTDPSTGESKTDWVCDYKTTDKCEWQTSTYEECVADPQPYYPEPEPYYPEPEPYYPPAPVHVPATLSNLHVGDLVVTMNYTYLQVGTQVLAQLRPGTTLRVEKIHYDGWFWTTYGQGPYAQKGWVKVRNVYIRR